MMPIIPAVSYREKYFTDFSGAIRSMTRVGEVYEPAGESARVYQELFEKVYLRMYAKLQPLYDDIRSITGYPARH